MLQKKLILIRRGEEGRFEVGASPQILPRVPPPRVPVSHVPRPRVPCPRSASATVVIALYFTLAFILPMLFVTFGEGSSLLAHLETDFIAEEKGTIQVFISY